MAEANILHGKGLILQRVDKVLPAVWFRVLTLNREFMRKMFLLVLFADRHTYLMKFASACAHMLRCFA